MKKFTVGTDPEFILVDEEQNLKSAIPVIPAGKHDVEQLEKGGVMHDNVLVEFNTTPSDNEDEFIETIQTVLKQVADKVGAQGFRLKVQAAAKFPAKELDHQEAREFGCEPDFNAWQLRPNVLPPDAERQPIRSCGGHLHIGMGDNEKLNETLGEPLGKVEVVKALDIFIGIPSVFLDKDPSAQTRRYLYGKAGAHRPKGYGVEYRAVSAWWLAGPDKTRLVYRLAGAGLDSVIQDELDKITEEIGGSDKVQEIINEGLEDEARKVFENIIRPRLEENTNELLESVDQQNEVNLYDHWNLA